MKPLAAAFLLLCAVPAGATDAQKLWTACRNNASSVYMFYNRLPESARPQFERMYGAYADMVRRRKAEGWTNGLMGNQSTNWRRSFREYGIAGLVKTADSPASKAALEREISELEREFETASRDRRREILTRLTEIRQQASLPRGVCEDWAKETSEVARGAASPEFKVEWHEIRRGGHAVTFVTHASGACIAMDPWYRGLPELVGCGEAEDISASETPSCFAAYPPPAD